MRNIRNFSIIAHIDHGKSTLADRMLELTGTIEKRKMREQVLDQMELERERGITIKMQPVRMLYRPNRGSSQNSAQDEEYLFNLIDTPGHIDFSYEVSRALKAVEGAILLVDSTQGVQAQTLTTLSAAQELGLTIIPVLSKIDAPLARIAEVKEEVKQLLKCDDADVLLCSGKTGEGVDTLLRAVVERIPPPRQEFQEEKMFRSLIFDFQYSNHRGVEIYVRVFDGKIKKGETLFFKAAGEKFTVIEVGTFSPDETPREYLQAGEIGYIVTGIKRPGIASVGDTLLRDKSTLPALPGYLKPSPVVWASVYPESQDDFALLKQALLRLQLSDSSLSFEEETSGVLGRGFRCGFLGMLHLEIVGERLRREFDLELTITTPSITYEIEHVGGKKELVYSSIHFPEHERGIKVLEPIITLKIITKTEYVSAITQLLYEHEGVINNSEMFGDLSVGTASSRMIFFVRMPLRELMRNFFPKLKTATSGYASFSYEITGMQLADVVRLDVLIAEELVPAFSRIVARKRLNTEAESLVEKLYKHLPRQLFETKIQARADGRIIASRKFSALKKDVTGHLYGGDITRKRKLWEKQKKGKKRLKERGKVTVPHNVYLKVMRTE